MLESPFRHLWLGLLFMLLSGVTAAVWQYPEGLWNPTPAAWAQALGVIGSIFVALWIGASGERRRRNDLADARREFVSFIMEISQQARDLVEGASQDILRTADAVAHSGGNEGDFVSMAAAMRAIDVTEFRMAGPMLAFLQLIAAVDAGPYWFRQVIGDYNKHGGLSPMTEDDVVDWAARAELLLQEMRALK